MFVDSVSLTVSAGKGGNGVIAWRREKYIPKGGPYGGNGGNGGAIILEADEGEASLQRYRHTTKIIAQDGAPGGAALRQGKSGKDLILKVPCGTLVKDQNSQEILSDLSIQGQRFLLCQGGKGGKGNASFKSPTHQAPHIYTEGTLGESKDIQLELKLIAEIGLIGMPNAGKSTLMKRLTHVPVKIGAYPFTTLFPNLGYLYYQNYQKVLIADIPGIIKDAHKDKGLGFAFLKHIERSKVLVFVLDASFGEERHAWEDFLVLREEIEAYKQELLEKPFLVILNKCDAPESQVIIEEFKAHYPYSKDTLFVISALENIGLDPLKEAIAKLILPPAMAWQ